MTRFRTRVLPASRAAIALFVLAALAGFPARALCQVTAAISGTVVDETGGALPGATVTVRNTETGATRVLVSDANGRYQALSLPVGKYEGRAEMSGFKTVLRSGVTLVVGQEAVINFTLSLGTVSEEVIVSAEAPVVNATTTSMSGLVSEREVKTLPLNGRSFDNLITLNPGTVLMSTRGKKGGTEGGFSVSGRRLDDNLFLFNGVEYMSSSQGGTTPGGVSGQLLGIDAIREFNVVKPTYPAEYGKRAGGQVSVVTMSGTNTLRGTVFEFLRDDAFDARNFFDRGSAPPPFRRQNFGFALGGPLMKDRAFVFGNFEGLRENVGLSNVAIVPSDTTRSGFVPDATGRLVNIGVNPGIAPYLALWPRSNGPELPGGWAYHYSDPTQTTSENFYTLRFDQNFSSSNSVNVGYTYDGGTSYTPGVNPLNATDLDLRNQVMNASWTRIFSSNVVNSFTYGYSRSSYFSNPHSEIDFPDSLSLVKGKPIGALQLTGTLSTAGIYAPGGSGGQGVEQRVKRQLWAFEDKLQMIRGAHTFSIGGRLGILHSDEDQASQKFGLATFATLQDLMRGVVTTFTAGLNAKMINFRQKQGAWFVQDDIKVTPKLTLNLGLRHEFTDGWNGGQANPAFDDNGVILTKPWEADTALIENKAKWLFGPRANLAWVPAESGRTALHAGYGRYFSLVDTLGFFVGKNPPYNNRIVVRNFQLPFSIDPAAPPAAAQWAPLGVQPDMGTPTVDSWTVRLEHELFSAVAVTLAYIGSHGKNEMMTLDGNTAIPTICKASLNNCPAGLADGTKYFPPNSPRRNPALANSAIYSSASRSNYHGVEIDLNRRMSHGFSVRGSYTWSQSKDDFSAQGPFAGANGGAGNSLDPEDPDFDYGRSTFDVEHRVRLSGSFELPFGRDAAGLGGKLASGWQLNWIMSLQSGFPFTPLAGFNRSRNGDLRAPDRLSNNPAFKGDPIVGTVAQWYDPNAFILPVAGTYGNVVRGTLVGPKLTSLDMSAFKNTTIGRLATEFRFEVFNVLNRANFALPNNRPFNTDGSIAGGGTAITATSTSSRQIQLGFKVKW